MVLELRKKINDANGFLILNTFGGIILKVKHLLYDTFNWSSVKSSLMSSTSL